MFEALYNVYMFVRTKYVAAATVVVSANYLLPDTPYTRMIRLIIPRTAQCSTIF